MQAESWSETATRALGVSVATLVLGGPGVAGELADVTPLTTPQASAAPSEPPAPGLDPERPAEDGREADAVVSRTEPESESESPSLPTPAEDIAAPTLPEIVPDSVIRDSFLSKYITSYTTPRPLRRPRHLP